MKSAKVSLLVLDADLARQKDLAETLAACNYHTETSADSETIFNPEVTTIIDLIFIHVSIASAQEFTLLQKTQAHENLRHIPIVIYGVKDDLINIDHAIELGATDYLTLPTTPVLLKTRIRASLEKRLFSEQAAWYLREFNEMEKLADPSAARGAVVNSVVGKVWMTEYQGSWVKVSITLPDGEEFVANIDDGTFFANPVREGDTVSARWSPAAVHSLEHRESGFDTSRVGMHA